jgi:hypothetical protein
MSETVSRYESRKWQMAAVALVAWIVLFAIGRLSETALIELATWTLGLYFGANVAQKTAQWFTGAIEKKE